MTDIAHYKENDLMLDVCQINLVSLSNGWYFDVTLLKSF